MIWVVGVCKECPAFWKDASGHCGCAKLDKRIEDDSVAESSRPDWCPLQVTTIRVDEVSDAALASGANMNAVLVFACETCPFYFETDKRRCAIGNPPCRPIMSDDPRPKWCRLRKETAIVRKRA